MTKGRVGVDACVAEASRWQRRRGALVAPVALASTLALAGVGCASSDSGCESTRTCAGGATADAASDSPAPDAGDADRDARGGDAAPDGAPDGDAPLACAPGTHACAGACVDDDDVAHCGRSCDPCPSGGPYTERSCDGVQCGARCLAGYHACAGVCVSALDVATCGASCAACAEPLGGHATCDGRACGVVCDAGSSLCPDGACRAVDEDPLHCGSSCVACSAPSDATPTCAMGACGYACDAGFVATGGACAWLPAPRPIAPAGFSVSTTASPRFAWSLPVGADGATLRICADAACARVEAELGVSGDSVAALPLELAPGPHHWDLRARAGDVLGVEASPRWEVFVGGRSAPRAGSAGTLLDVDADGLADALVASPGASPASFGVFRGEAGGPSSSPAITATMPAARLTPIGVAGAGDVDGDGFADVVAVDADEPAVHVFRGSARGLALDADVGLGPAAASSFAIGRACAGVGDVDGDGYADVAVASVSLGRVHVFAGGPLGLSASRVTSLDAGGVAGAFGRAVGAAGDVDADGYADVLSGATGTSGAGHVFVHLGARGGLAPSPTIVLASPDGSPSFGAAFASAGDVDADGYADVVVGEPAWAGHAGRAFVFRGGPSGTAASPSTTIEARDGALGELGGSVAAAGDVDADGYDDVLVAAWAAPFDAATSTAGPGRVHVFRGGALGLASTPVATLTTSTPGALFGAALAGLGDVDADGFGDVLVGAPCEALASGACGEGRAHFFRGGPTALAGSRAAVRSGLATGDRFGAAVSGRQ